MKENIKVGDRVLVKRLFSLFNTHPFHVYVKRIGRDWLGDYLYGNYTVQTDYMGDYDTIGKFRPWHILFKD